MAHNHPIIKESYQFHHRNRKIPEELKQSAIDMLATGSKAALVALLMSKRSGKIILSKDLHNLTRRIKQTDMEKLQKVIDSQRNKDGADYFHFIQNEKEDEFYGLFYQSKNMQRLFATYGKVMFVDGTYRINKKHYPCIIYTVTDHERTSRIVGFAIIAYERLLVMDVICGYFATLNNTSNLEIVMIDKGLNNFKILLNLFINFNLNN